MPMTFRFRETGCWRCRRPFVVDLMDEARRCDTCGWDHCPSCGACQRQCAAFRRRVADAHQRPFWLFDDAGDFDDLAA